MTSMLTITPHNTSIKSPQPTSFGVSKLSILCSHETPPLQRWTRLAYQTRVFEKAKSRSTVDHVHLQSQCGMNDLMGGVESASGNDILLLRNSSYLECGL